MTNWQVFKINDSNCMATCCYESNIFVTLYLDEYIEFADGYDKVFTIKNPSVAIPGNGGFIEIDLDQTKLLKKKDQYQKDRYLGDRELREIPQELAIRRRMERAASADPTALAITREAMDRVDRGEKTGFEYKIVDNSGNTHC
jgi:hypothetical protein